MRTSDNQLFCCKSIDKLISDSEEPERRLKKTLGPVSLTALGIGAVIGSGIFTVIGTAIAGQKFDTSSILNAPLLDYLIRHHATLGRPGAGPALALSLVLVAIVCGFTALCYAELASMIPIAGSAYTYTYATMGELIAWIIGWDLILEYAVSNMAVSVGFAAHLVDMFDWFGWHPALRWISPAYLPGGLTDLQGQHALCAGPALRLQYSGVSGRDDSYRDSGARHSRIGRSQQHHGDSEDRGDPGVRHRRRALRQSGQLASVCAQGWSGILTGGSIIFFTYIGFDSVSTAAEEAKNPQRDLPIGIIATLVVCTVLYIAVAVVLTGIVPWQSLLDDAAPVVNSLKSAGSSHRARIRCDGSNWACCSAR